MNSGSANSVAEPDAAVTGAAKISQCQRKQPTPGEAIK